MNLSGFSAVYPGYMAQENQTATTEQNQAAAKEAALKLLGAHVLGRALTGGQQGPQPPAPGQSSVPNQPAPAPNPQPPAPMAQGAPAAQQPPQAQGAAGAPPSAGGSGMPEISLQALQQRIMQTSPQVVNHPEIMLAALERAAPILDRQGKEDLAEMRKTLATQRLQQAGELARARQESLDSWRGAQGNRADRRLDQGDTREARLAANSAVRNDAMTQRLQMQQQDLERKIQAGDRGAALAQWRATTDALHKRATEIIQSNSIASSLSDADKKALLDEQRQAYEGQITAMRGMAGSTTPQGGTAPAGAPAAPKVEGQVPQNAPLVTSPAAAASAPPLAMLKPNTITTFQNGQKWTIGPDGQPKQVQ